MLERIRQEGLEQEKKRLEEWKKREQRIEQAMNRMADTVIKKQADKEQALEEKIKVYEEHRLQSEQKDEQRRQLRLRKNNEDLRKALRD